MVTVEYGILFVFAKKSKTANLSGDIVTSVINSKNSQPPASLGVNYYREER